MNEDEIMIEDDAVVKESNEGDPLIFSNEKLYPQLA